MSVGLPTAPNIVGIGMWVKVTTAALMETLTFGPIFLIYELLFWHNVAMVSKRKGRRLSGQPASGTRAATGTYQTRVSNYSGMDRSAGDAVLAAYGELYSRVQRKLVAAVAAGRSATSLKSAYLKRYGIPARMLNGARVLLEGKMASVREQQRLRAVDLSARIKRAEKQIAGLGEQSSWDQVHQKKRRLVNLRSRLAALEADISADRTRLCFGSKRLWRKQNHLEANGYTSHEEWLRDWQAARSDEFFVLGSRDETAGCQLCVATIADDGTLTLRLRMPDCLVGEHGKHLVIEGVRFAYWPRRGAGGAGEQYRVRSVPAGARRAGGQAIGSGAGYQLPAKQRVSQVSEK